MIDTEGGLLRGTLDVLILKAVSWGPRHGYAIAEWVKTITEEEVLVEEGLAHRRVGLLGEQPQGEVLRAEPNGARRAAQ
jgi:hypothetical protein